MSVISFKQYKEMPNPLKTNLRGDYCVMFTFTFTFTFTRWPVATFPLPLQATYQALLTNHYLHCGCACILFQAFQPY